MLWILTNWISVALGVTSVAMAAILGAWDAAFISGYIWAIGTAVVSVLVYAMKNLAPLWIQCMKEKAEIKRQSIGTEVEAMRKKMIALDRALEESEKKLRRQNREAARRGD